MQQKGNVIKVCFHIICIGEYIDNKQSFKWMKHSSLKDETEGFIVAT